MKQDGLSKAVATLEDELVDYGLTVDQKARLMRTAGSGTFGFPRGASERLCKEVILAGMRAVDSNSRTKPSREIEEPE